MSWDQDIKNYSRTFLLEYSDISQFDKLKAIYDTYIEYIRIDNDLNQSKGVIN